MAGHIEEIKDQFEKAMSELESKHPTVVKAELNAKRIARSKFNEYQNELRKIIDSMKVKIASYNASLAGVSLDDIGCLTSKRVLNAVVVCKIIDVSREAFSRLLSKEE